MKKEKEKISKKTTKETTDNEINELTYHKVKTKNNIKLIKNIIVIIFILILVLAIKLGFYISDWQNLAKDILRIEADCVKNHCGNWK